VEGYRRKQYVWMIAAGWGSFVMAVVVAVVAGVVAGDKMTENVAVGVQIGVGLLGLITMFSCYSVSSGAATKAKELETGKTVPPDGTT